MSGQFSQPLVDQSPEKLRKVALSEAVLTAMSSFRTICKNFETDTESRYWGLLKARNRLSVFIL
jgi:hypothetical protein